MILSISDKAIIIGMLGLGVFFGVTFAYDTMSIATKIDSVIFDSLLFVYYAGLLLTVSGVIYKIVKWTSIRRILP